MPLKIGLTGNIGCGKSTVAQMMGRRGFKHIDTDQIARDILLPPSPVLGELVRVFGDGILRGDSLDRAALARVVFDDPSALKRLNQITHPAIGRSLLQKMGNTQEPVVVSVPLLFEAGMEGFFDEVWVVTCPAEEQFARIMKRGGISPEEARKRMESQMPQTDKVKKAHKVIPNEGDLQDLEREVEKAVQTCRL